MKKFTASEVYAICGKVVEELTDKEANKLQVTSIEVGFLILYSELVLAQITSEENEQADV